jgi:hypothetical protein
MELRERQSQTPEYPVPLTGTERVIEKFNRNTTWVATGLLGSVIFAALILALIGRDPKVDDVGRPSCKLSWRVDVKRLLSL